MDATSELVDAGRCKLAVTYLGSASGCQVVWGHGWGQTSASFVPMAQSLARFARSSLIDFPGFGASPMPPEPWGNAEYADAVAQWLESLPPSPRVWVGHSFGCRIGMHIAARYPHLLSGLVLIAAPGLPRRRSFVDQIKYQFRRNAFRIAKVFIPEGPKRDALRAKFGSADYSSAGAMRATLVRVVGEDLAPTAAKIQCPVTLVYGGRDQDTPPEIGERFQKIIRGSELVVLDGFDHLGLLEGGRQQAAAIVRRFLETVCR